MADTNPEHQKLLQAAEKARGDQTVADQFQGALETLREKAADDHVVADQLPKCRAFRRLLHEFRQSLAPLVAAIENRDPVPADFNPSKAQRLLPEWEAARTVFLQDYRAHVDYLEKLALRLVR
jgi:hypothetical protein